MDIFAKFGDKLGPIGDYAEKAPGYFAFPKLEGEIGNRMITRDPDITRLLNRLEDRAFVERNRDKQDRRVIYGKITAAGLKLLREMDGPIDKRGREMLRHVGQEKLKELIELLELVRGTKPVHRRDAEGAE